MAIDVTLRVTERNNVLQLIESSGFDPADFEWSQADQTARQGRLSHIFRVSVLTHKRSGYYIVFGGISTTMSPGINQKVEAHEDMGQWGLKQSYCGYWLQELRKEVETPDLWASVGQERALANAAASEGVDNKPFTPVERQIISASLKEIKARLLSMQQFDSRQAAIIDNQFKYLDEAGQRMGRKDWLMLSVGTMVTESPTGSFGLWRSPSF